MADETQTAPSNEELFRQAVTPQATEEPQVQGAVPAETPAIPPEAPAEPAAPEAAIPSWRLREEADARRAAEENARQLQERLALIEAHVRQQQPQAKQPDFFENPDAATQAVVARVLKPLVDDIARDREIARQNQIYMGKMLAESVHGADKVAEAEQAFLEAREQQTLDVADYERVVTSPNRYDEVVKWHRRQSVLASVGDDPAAWFERELANRMSDPKFQADMLEKVRGNAARQPSVTRLPPSLSKTTGAPGNGPSDLGDMSDASLFAHAMKR